MYRNRLLHLAACAVLLAMPAFAGVTVITSIPAVIDAPGMYVLEDNLTGDAGIIIIASHVTLDLGGFGLFGTGEMVDGILVRGVQTDIEITNGTVQGWGRRGIYADYAYNSYFHDLRLSENGECGMRGGQTAVVEHVTAVANGRSGIAVLNGGVVTDSTVGDNGGWGLEGGECCTFTSISALHNGGGGIFVGSGSLVHDTTARLNGWAVEGGAESSSYEHCALGTLAGIAVLGSGSLVENNVLTGNTIGLQFLGSHNVCRDNLVQENIDNYDFASGNDLNILLSEIPEDIDWPASVIVAGTLQGVSGRTGLNINASGVTVDLAGHGLIGADGPQSLCGIFVGNPITQLVVKNGFLRGWGGCGIRAILADDSEVFNVLSEHNDLDGMRLGNGSSIKNCTAEFNGIDGISVEADGVILGCTALGNGHLSGQPSVGDGIQVGMDSLVSQCASSDNFGLGMRALEGSTVVNNTVSGNFLGISTSTGSMVRSNTVSASSGSGIRASSRSYILDNLVYGNGMSGIVLIDSMYSRVQGNNVSGNFVGINVLGTNNLIVKNSLSDNGTDLAIPAGNTFGKLVTTDGEIDPGAWSNVILGM